jgi:hypothetical protein
VAAFVTPMDDYTNGRHQEKSQIGLLLQKSLATSHGGKSITGAGR